MNYGFCLHCRALAPARCEEKGWHKVDGKGARVRICPRCITEYNLPAPNPESVKTKRTRRK